MLAAVAGTPLTWGSEHAAKSSLRSLHASVHFHAVADPCIAFRNEHLHLRAGECAAMLEVSVQP